MGLINKIKKTLGLEDTISSKWTWEIHRVGNPEKFMGFVLSHAPRKSVWVLDTMLSEEKLLASTGFEFKDGKIALTKSAIPSLIDLLPELDLEEDFIHHMIFNPDGRTFLLAYDNFSCVWLSKSIKEETIEEAAQKFDFDYIDSEVPKDGSA